MAKSLVVGYKLTDGTNICLSCAGEPEQNELMKSKENREVMFRSDYSETRCPKCFVCKRRMLDIELTVREKVQSDDAPSPPEKTAPKKTTLRKRRGRPSKAKTELYFNNSPLSEPPTKDGVVIKRGRGRPKGSKNKPKAQS